MSHDTKTRPNIKNPAGSNLDHHHHHHHHHHTTFVVRPLQTKLEGCIVLNEPNTVFARSGPLYATGVSLGPPESSTQTASQSLQPFLQASLGERQIDRPTDHATQSVTIGGAHSREAKFCYCLRLQQVTTSIYWSSRLKYAMPAFPS